MSAAHVGDPRELCLLGLLEKHAVDRQADAGGIMEAVAGEPVAGCRVEVLPLAQILKPRAVADDSHGHAGSPAGLKKILTSSIPSWIVTTVIRWERTAGAGMFVILPTREKTTLAKFARKS